MRTEEQEYLGIETIDIAEYNNQQEEAKQARGSTGWKITEVLHTIFIAWWMS